MTSSSFVTGRAKARHRSPPASATASSAPMRSREAGVDDSRSAAAQSWSLSAGAYGARRSRIAASSRGSDEWRELDQPRRGDAGAGGERIARPETLLARTIGIAGHGLQSPDDQRWLALERRDDLGEFGDVGDEQLTDQRVGPRAASSARCARA